MESLIIKDGGATWLQAAVHVTAYSLGWAAIFAAICHHPRGRKRDMEYRSRVLSVAHGVISTIMALYACDFHVTNHSISADPSTALQTHVCLSSFSYFLVDLIVSYIFGYLEGHFLLHHGITMNTMLWGALADSGYVVAASTALFEVTNPSMHYRWLLMHDGVSSGFEYWFHSLFFVVVFFVARLWYATLLGYNYMQHAHGAFLIRMNILAIFVLTVYHSGLILHGAIFGETSTSAGNPPSEAEKPNPPEQKRRKRVVDNKHNS